MGGLRPHRGITFIEATIAVAIIAIVLAAAAPNFSTFISRQRLEGAAAELVTDIRFARSEAVQRSAALRLSVQHGADGDCYVLFTAASPTCDCPDEGPAHCPSGAQEIKTVHLPQSRGVSLVSNVAGLLFDPLHGTATPGGTLTLATKQGLALHAVVNLMGRVRLCAPHGDIAGYAAC